MHLTISFIYSLLFISVVSGGGQPIIGNQDNTGGSTKIDGGTTKSPTASIVLTYTCSSNVISIANVTGGTFNNIQVLKKGNGVGFCRKADDTKTGLETCIQSNTVGGKVYLLYQHETSRELVAGDQFAYVELTCKENMEIKHAKLEIINKFRPTDAPDWKTFSPIQNSGDLSLSITPDSDLHVGQPLKLTMTIAGSGYIISPVKCNATRKSDDTFPVPIWNCHSLADDNIISDVKWTPSDSQRSVSINMLAFKFVNSENVIIQCSANVCPSSSQECKLDACTHGTGLVRKRRDLNNLTTGINIPVEHASVSMKVKDPLLNRSSGLTTIWYAYFVPVFAMISARLYL